MYHALISFVVWFIAYAIIFGAPHVTTLYLPLLLLPFALFIMGLNWFLASLGVYLRDVSQFIGVITMSMMFLSPIFYSANALPEAYRNLLYLNPLTPAIEQTRDVLYWGRHPDFELLGLYFLATATICWLGFAWFQKTRKGFADVL
jgi:lipopolysaccharide transport system permease protein